MSEAREWVSTPSVLPGGAEDRFRRAAALPARLAPATRPAPHGAAILVTGATGFLGGHLLNALLKRSSAPIVCLVRGDEGAARERLRARLASFGTAVSPDRIAVLSASLAEPRLGLAAGAFARLAESIGTLFHLAARLDFRSSFDTLRAANVESVRQILALAAAGVAKRVVYVSSLSVLETVSNYGQTVSEATTLRHPELLPLGYAQCKWTAEVMLAAARARGFEVLRLRPSWIVGHERVGNDAGFIASLVRACAAVRATVDGPGGLNLVRVEFVGEACALLGLAPARPDGLEQGVVHLGMPEAIGWRQFHAAIAATGRRIEHVQLGVYLARLAEELRTTRSLELMMFRHILVGSALRPPIALPYMDGRAPVFDSAKSLRALGSAGLPPPVLDLESLVPQYLRTPLEP